MFPQMLTDEQRTQFDRDGFLVVRNALPEELVGRLIAAADRLFDSGVTKDGLTARHHWHMRNCIGADPVFLELLDHPAVLPLVAGILGWDIHMITSHLVVRPPLPEGIAESFRGEGWHRDGGQSSWEMTEPHPRLFLKAAFFLSDQTEMGRGNTMVVPGSNRLTGPPAKPEGGTDPYGAIEVTGKPGDMFLFEQRCWHAAGQNLSDNVRKTLFFGYGFRWIRPMDYLVPDPELVARANPIQRQLLGDVPTPMGIYLPTEEDVPLREWWREHYGKNP
ncbi:MAG: hypothetical protein OHK0029_29140 [Armatimonadaceae bacterium]